jgi:hypothetical protein
MFPPSWKLSTLWLLRKQLRTHSIEITYGLLCPNPIML